MTRRTRRNHKWVTKEIFERVYAECGYNIPDTAESFMVTRSLIYTWIYKYDIHDKVKAYKKLTEAEMKKKYSLD